MNIVIIEDELMSADDLADILKQIDPSITVCGIFPSVKKATAYLKTAPAVDLIFSDIQLGDGLSFEIFKEVKINTPVIFCTAYDEYALEAFKANGIDYILKPFTTETLSDALQKYRQLKEVFSTNGEPQTLHARREAADHAVRGADIPHCRQTHKEPARASP